MYRGVHSGVHQKVDEKDVLENLCFTVERSVPSIASMSCVLWNASILLRKVKSGFVCVSKCCEYGQEGSQRNILRWTKRMKEVAVAVKIEARCPFVRHHSEASIPELHNNKH